MSRPEIVKVYRNDKLYSIEFTVKDADGNAVSLASATAIVLKAQLQGAAVNKFTSTMVASDAPNGKALFTPVAGNFDTAGTYNAEIEVTYNDGKVITFNRFLFDVREDLPLTVL